MGQGKLHGLYWVVNGGELKDSGTDGTGETAWFVLGGEWWWVVDSKTVGQMGQEKLHGLYWVVNGGGWWTQRQWTDGTRETHGKIKNTHRLLVVK
jgi:hypothetical protein